MLQDVMEAFFVSVADAIRISPGVGWLWTVPKIYCRNYVRVRVYKSDAYKTEDT